MGQCVYKNEKEEVKSCQVGHCPTISKGIYVAKYQARGVNSERESLMIR
ncbi:MAG: hypothetical protein ACFFCI_20515 [Promethearchaeota archaeon]